MPAGLSRDRTRSYSEAARAAAEPFKGEITLVIAGAEPVDPTATADLAQLRVAVRELVDAGSSTRDAVTDVANATGVQRKVVYAAGNFQHLDESPLPPAMPDWSPVRVFGGYAAWDDAKSTAARQSHAHACGCASACSIHGHDHMTAWSANLPIPESDLKSFWGALGCACWAV